MISNRAMFAASASFVLAALLTSVSVQAAAPELTVKKGGAAKVVINPNKTMRPSLPGSLYSSNMQYNLFESKHWDRNKQEVRWSVRNMLSNIDGALYRYPGGLPSNHYDVETATLPYATRKSKRSSGGSRNKYPLFGVQEYVDFIKDVSNGTPWYTINLLGAGTTQNPVEWSQWKIGQTNEKLAKFLAPKTSSAPVHYYQLGNELDRNHFQWSHQKYIDRSKAAMDKIKLHDKKARFVPFMREFTWKYKWPKTGTSTAEKYFKDVMTKLPNITDFSLHFYFDGKLSPSAPFVTVPDVISKIDKALSLAKKAKWANYNVWITEYGKRFYLSGGKPESGNSFDAALATGDFLIALAQYNEVQGAFLQGLDGGNRKVFYDSNTPTSAAWALRILAGNPYQRVLASTTTSPNSSGYKGGYDIRAVATTNGAGDKLGVNVVNRSKQGKSLQIVYPKLANKSLKRKLRFVRAPNGANPKSVEKNFIVQDKPWQGTAKFNGSGATYVWIPPQSVAQITFE